MPPRHQLEDMLSDHLTCGIKDMTATITFALEDHIRDQLVIPLRDMLWDLVWMEIDHES